jgi:cytochrome c1
MPTPQSSPQAYGRMGGLTTAALAPSPQAITAAANAARWQRYVDQVKAVLPELTDPAELQRRAQLLMKADMVRLSEKAARARRLKAQLREAEADLAAAQAEAGAELAATETAPADDAA